MDDSRRKAITQKAWDTRMRKYYERWDVRAQGLTPGEAAEKFYKRGYQTGWARGRQGKKAPKAHAA
jgi:hypothetical protein